MLDLKKPLKTRDGREVRIYATDGRGPRSLVGAVKYADGQWTTHNWYEGGTFWAPNLKVEAEIDLFNVPETRTVKGWAILWKDGSAGIYVKGRNPEPRMDPYTAGIIPIELTFTIGEGLD